MPDIGGTLTRFLSHHECLWINEAKAVNDDFALDGLNGIHDERHAAGVEQFKGGLRIDIGTRQPATKAGMRMVPPDDVFGTPRLPQHGRHFGLKDRIDVFHGNRGSGLRHGVNVDAINGVIVHEFTQHESHDFHRHSGASVFQHFK
mmetsp:Transcript_32039/g.83041  ORF Transcript_32039/g.83041 Transcript_32039/m.83041 type:complete len:146 (+) Transcript_32039:402-839(+)